MPEFKAGLGYIGKACFMNEQKLQPLSLYAPKRPDRGESDDGVFSLALLPDLTSPYCFR